MGKKNFLEFSVSVYGNLEKYNDVLSKSRCRIFYKYGNRNGCYITDEYAEKLLASLPYAPVKGIYEAEQEEDYTDHGTERSEGRIYGIVPESPNIIWENHLDEDGIERTYACADVLIFTALYKEASEIVGKSQSMELYVPSIKCHQEIIQGQKWTVYDEGVFLGLQVLGEKVEPCFEGAAFYNLQNSIEDIIKKIEIISTTYDKKGGNSNMPMLNFKLSDDQKYQAIWALLNEHYNEANEWAIDYAITSVYDDYALAFNYSDMTNERIYYTKDDSTDSLKIEKKEKVFVMDITETEKGTIDALRVLNGDTYDLVDESLSNAKENLEKNSEFSAKNEELESQVTTLITEKSETETLYTETKGKLEELGTELESLKDFKLEVEKIQKEEVLSEYSEKLGEEILTSYREKMENFTVTELDKELAYELKTTNPEVFSKNPLSGYVPKDNQVGGIEEILSKYKK